MDHTQKFNQQWEFRRRENDSDSSSSESLSSSSSELVVLKKHILLSKWMPPKINGRDDVTKSLSRSRSTKANKMQICSNSKEYDPIHTERKREMSSCEVDYRKKSKRSEYDPSSLNNVRVFMESILEELKVAREKMFIWMREEMQKVLDDDTVQNHNSFNSKSLSGSTKRKRTTDTPNGHKAHGDQSIYCQTSIPMFSNETERRVVLGSSDKEYSNQANSMYLTLPTVLPEICVKEQKINSSSHDLFRTRVIENKEIVSIRRENLLLDSSIHLEGPSGLQEEEYFGNIAHIGSQDLGFVDQNKLIMSSSFGNGFPIPLHHGLDGGFKIQTQASMQNLSQVQNSILHSSINGGDLRFVRGSHGLSDLNITNNLSNHFSSKTHDGAWSRGSSIPGSQKEFVMHELVYQ